MKKYLFLFIGLVGFATVYDEQIAELLFARAQGFADFFYVYGEVPSLVLGTFAWLWVAKGLNDKNLHFVAILIAFGFGMSVVMQPLRYLGYFNIWMIPILAILMILLMRKFNQLMFQVNDQYFNYFLIIGITTLLAIALPQAIKLIWARPRPYRVFSGEAFQAWTIGLNLTLDNAYKSFPSGHSALAASLMTLAEFKPELKPNYYKLMMSCIGVYVGLMMISRMVRGDHYLSDVLFGMFLTIVIYRLSSKWVRK